MKKILHLCITLCIAVGCSVGSQKNDVIITINTNNTISQMQGGFGASIHAIEDSIVVSTDRGQYRSWGGSVWGCKSSINR